MNWESLGNAVAKFAPLLGGAVAGPGGAVLGSMIASTFGAEPEPERIAQAIAADPEAAVKLREIESNRRVELERIAVQRAANELAADTARLEQINQTMREELRTDNWFKSSWRPLLGYFVALSFAGFIFAIAWTLIEAPANLNHVAEAIEASTVIWVFALSVLGINVRSRSHDKQTRVGQTPTTLLSAMLAKDGK